jgi:AraC family transcriptional regulator, transcriptional activator of the genes for pyochelin and ferripyochelin receptors
MDKQKTVRFDEAFSSEIIELPYIKIASNHHTNKSRTLLHETKDTSPFDRKDQVVITYVLAGHVESSYTGLQQVFHNQDGKASFVYGPHDNEHLLAENQYIDSVAIGIDKAFFQDLLNNEEDPWIEGLLKKMENRRPYSPTPESYPISAGILHLLGEIRQPGVHGALKGLFRQSKLCDLLLKQIQDFHRFQLQDSNPGIPKRDLEKLYWVRDFIEKNALRQISLSQLSRDSGLNLFKLKKEFKELFGATVFEKVRAHRMQRAMALLTDTDSTVGEVAEAIGYEHVQHFSTAFKKYFGNPPSHYLSNRSLTDPPDRL